MPSLTGVACFLSIILYVVAQPTPPQDDSVDPLDKLQDVVATGLEEVFDEDGDMRYYHTKLYDIDLTAANPGFPENTINSSSIGVAFSGGGTRSMTATMGQLRALKASGVLAEVTHISSTSGGSWANSIWNYGVTSGSKATTDTDLLGTVVRPEDLCDSCSTTDYDVNTVSSKSIGSVATSISKSDLIWTAADSILLGLVGIFLDADTAPHRTWTLYIRKQILDPFGISDSLFYGWPFADTSASKTTIVNANSETFSSSSDFDLRRSSRDPLWINTGALIPDPSKPYDLVPLEVTPLYIGTPQWFPGKGSKNQDIGGGYVEPFAFDSSRYHKATLKVAVYSASGVKDEDFGWGRGHSDCYCDITVSDGGDGQASTLKVWKNGEHEETSEGPNPVWFSVNAPAAVQTFNIGKYKRGTTVKLSVLDWDRATSSDELGEYTFQFEDISVTPTEPASATTITLSTGATATLKIWVSDFSTELSSGRLKTSTRARQYSLADALGASSFEPAVGLAANSLLIDDIVIPRFAYFSPRSTSLNNINNAPCTLQAVDGGSLDNTAVLTLLVRGITRVISFVNSGVPLSKDTSNRIVVDRQLAALFGYQEKEENKAWTTFSGNTLNKDENAAFQHNQVFKSSEFQTVIDALYDAKDAGEPIMYSNSNMEVQSNSYYGIKSYNISIVIFYNDLNGQWKQRITDTNVLNEFDTEVSNFPNYKTSSQLQLNSQEVNFLSNMWQTTLLQENTPTCTQKDVISVLKTVTGITTLSAPTGFNTNCGTSSSGSSSLVDSDDFVGTNNHKLNNTSQTSIAYLPVILGGGGALIVIVVVIVVMRMRRNTEDNPTPSVKLEDHPDDHPSGDIA